MLVSLRGDDCVVVCKTCAVRDRFILKAFRQILLGCSSQKFGSRWIMKVWSVVCPIYKTGTRFVLDHESPTTCSMRFFRLLKRAVYSLFHSLMIWGLQACYRTAIGILFELTTCFKRRNFSTLCALRSMRLKNSIKRSLERNCWLFYR